MGTGVPISQKGKQTRSREWNLGHTTHYWVALFCEEGDSGLIPFPLCSPCPSMSGHLSGLWSSEARAFIKWQRLQVWVGGEGVSGEKKGLSFVPQWLAERAPRGLCVRGYHLLFLFLSQRWPHQSPDQIPRHLCPQLLARLLPWTASWASPSHPSAPLHSCPELPPPGLETTSYSEGVFKF